MRDPDRWLINHLKKEILDNLTTPVSPIVALACVPSGECSDGRHPQAYMYETIGGNNSRIALQELTQEYPDSPPFKTRLAAIYDCLCDRLTLRLASKHNRASEFTTFKTFPM